MLILMVGCSAGVPKHPTWKNATGAEQYERLMWKAIHEKNWNQVEEHLASMFVGVNAEGRVFDRLSWVEYWKAHPVSEYSLGEVTVQPAGTHMVVTYVLSLSGISGAPQAGQSLRVISVWQEVKNGWLLTATSATPVRS
ncbi:MAG TPA: nuclear transport factor 2 family protein [Candidatus Angelobacter sp.]